MSWKPEYLFLIMITTFVSFYGAKLIERSDGRRKVHMAACLIVNLGILFVFKYFNFFSGILAGTNGGFFELKVLLPVGISFYTFQTISYVIDVYRKKIKTEDDIVYFALYVSFFPQLVAGPIERASNLLPQLKTAHDFDYERIKNGIGTMLFGFFKKIVIADRAAVIVDKAFGGYADMPSLNIAVSVLLFGIQIYCDFSGYSDIAVGSAKIIGIDLMRNFERPYFSRSIGEFWKRWHISLSSWFMDYVYIPMGGNRKGILRTRLNLLGTFIISGLWHGANFTFIIWGAVHGLFLVFEKMLFDIKRRGILWVLPTYFLTNAAWVLFRADDLSTAMNIYGRIFGSGLSFSIRAFGLSTYQLTIMAASIVVLFIHSLIKENGLRIRLLEKSGYALAMFAIVFFGYFSSQEFIYFRF